MSFSGQLTPSMTLALLERIGHKPAQKLGQNFLIDSNIVRKSLELAEIKNGDSVAEVGPGLGTLTGALLEAGARVWAVELDKKLYGHISSTFEGNPALNVINADAVDMPLGAMPPEISEFKIVSNLPYAISTPWLDRVLSGRLPQMMSLMLQKEAATRFAAKNSGGDYSPISIFLNSAYDVAALHKVSAACFYPRPKVDSVLLALRLKPEPFVFLPQTKELVRKVFSRRRKQIASTAKDIADPAMLEWIESSQAFKPESRAETIDITQWQRLDSIIRKNA